MTEAERELVLELLARSEARVLGLVEGLAAEQWGFREAEGRWSIAENLEHLVVFEEFIRGTVIRVLEQAAEPEKSAAVRTKEPLVLGLAESRGAKLQARETLRPAGRWVDAGEMVAAFKATRARTMAFAAETQGELREHFFPHIAFGDLDCYQWLVVIGTHTERHALQIEEILRSARYPAG